MKHLDDEQPARLEHLRDVAEAVDLACLAGQVEQRVEHQVREPERTRHRDVGHVADDSRDRRATRLRTHQLDHRRRTLDALYNYAALSQGYRHPTGADSEPEDPATVRHHPGQEVDGRCRVEVGPPSYSCA